MRRRARGALASGVGVVAHADRQTDDHAGRRPPGAAAARVMRGTMCSASARSFAQYVMVPSATSPASFNISGASAATRIGAGDAPGTSSIDAKSKNSP